MSNSIIRGFHRIGIVCAILVAIVGIPLTGVLVVGEHLRIEALAQSIRQSAPPFDPSQPPDVVLEVKTGAAATTVSIKAAVAGLGITLGLMLAVWDLFRCLGWVVAGFAKD